MKLIHNSGTACNSIGMPKPWKYILTMTVCSQRLTVIQAWCSGLWNVEVVRSIKFIQGCPVPKYPNIHHHPPVNTLILYIDYPIIISYDPSLAIHHETIYDHPPPLSARRSQSPAEYPAQVQCEQPRACIWILVQSQDSTSPTSDIYKRVRSCTCTVHQWSSVAI